MSKTTLKKAALTLKPQIDQTCFSENASIPANTVSRVFPLYLTHDYD